MSILYFSDLTIYLQNIQFYITGNDCQKSKIDENMIKECVPGKKLLCDIQCAYENFRRIDPFPVNAEIVSW